MVNLEISEFENKFYSNFASKFVDIYDKMGEREAGLYAVENVKMDNMKTAQPFVKEAFEEKGYHFDD